LSRSSVARPLAVCDHRRSPTNPPTAAIKNAHQYEPVTPATKMRTCVFQGSALPESSKMAVILGTTSTISTPITSVPMIIIKIGYVMAPEPSTAARAAGP
jgi:hypothetical protein